MLLAVGRICHLHRLDPLEATALSVYAGGKYKSFILSGESCLAQSESEKLTAARSDAVTI